MRGVLAASLLSIAFLSGCSKEPVLPPMDLPRHPAVDALAAECVTMYCPKVRELALQVIQTGGAALPSLEAAWTWADDPDVMVWTKACIECIKSGSSLDEYKASLRRQMTGEDVAAATRAATHLHVMGDQEGFEFLQERSIREGRRFCFNFALMDAVNILHKRPLILSKIRALHSKRGILHDDVQADLINILGISPDYGRLHWDLTPPEVQRVFIEECNKQWEARRQEFESDYGGSWMQERKSFRKGARHLFE